MFDQIITECQIFNPTLERAFKVAPKEFISAYQWFIDNEGRGTSVLPHNVPDKLGFYDFKISGQSGIFSPSGRDIHYKNKQYAISVHTSKPGKNPHYKDRPPIKLEDGTWLLEYSAYREKETCTVSYNTYLLNCLNDGLPVGVIDWDNTVDQYVVRGLAFVERYNSATGMFTLHGPVNAKTINDSSFISAGFDDLEPEIQDQLEQIDDTDERIKELRESVRRQGQTQFRNDLLKAYANRCAISGNGVPQVLQAAHIGQYRGPKTQMVTNGILLRSDLHLLFDAHLLSVEPDSKRIRLSRLLDKTEYIDFNKKQLHMPVYHEAYPNEKQLERHFDQFMAETEILR